MKPYTHKTIKINKNCLVLIFLHRVGCWFWNYCPFLSKHYQTATLQLPAPVPCCRAWNKRASTPTANFILQPVKRYMLLWSCFCETGSLGRIEEILKRWKRDWYGAGNDMRQVWLPGSWFEQLVVVPLSKMGKGKGAGRMKKKNWFWTFVVWMK